MVYFSVTVPASGPVSSVTVPAPVTASSSTFPSLTSSSHFSFSNLYKSPPALSFFVVDPSSCSIA